MATSVLLFDKENKQKDYQYIARDMNGKLQIGWIVVEQPWYSPKASWTYWMYWNKYGGGFFGGASDLGLERTEVDPSTIRPYNQVEQIKYDLSIGMTVRLEKNLNPFGDAPEDNILAVINNEIEIPYELWTNTYGIKK